MKGCKRSWSRTVARHPSLGTLVLRISPARPAPTPLLPVVFIRTQFAPPRQAYRDKCFQSPYCKLVQGQWIQECSIIFYLASWFPPLPPVEKFSRVGPVQGKPRGTLVVSAFSVAGHPTLPRRPPSHVTWHYGRDAERYEKLGRYRRRLGLSMAADRHGTSSARGPGK